MNSSSEIALQTESLCFSYSETRVLHNLTLQVASGEFVALLGSNGAGKSTLISLLTGLYAADSGAVKIMNHDLQKKPVKALASIGVVFQKSTLDSDLTVEQNLRYFCALHGIGRSEADHKISMSLAQQGLAGKEKLKITALSGGQLRRVELARSLLHSPGLLLLDEPTVGLDHQSRAEFLGLVKELCEKSRTGVLWTTHLMDELAPSDSVYIMEKGKVLENGKLSDLYQSHSVADAGALFALLTGVSNSSDKGTVL